MITKSFRLTVIVLVIFIALAGMLAIWAFSKENLMVTKFTFTALWIVLIIYLIYYINHSNQALKTFLESVRHLDKVRRKSGSGRVNSELDQLYDEIVGTIRKVEIERESDRHYLRYMVEHVGVGIISFNERGEVELVNEAAKNLFGIRSVPHLTSLKQVSEGLPEVLSSIRNGESKLYKLSIGDETVSLILKATGFRLLDHNIRLVSIQNIKVELEEEELDAWQKLIRVLTHEITNSVTPIQSLSGTIISMFEENGRPRDIRELDINIIRNALEGLYSIEKRSKGLVSFVKSYRSLTRIKPPEHALFRVKSLFQNLALLEQHELESANINFRSKVNPEDLILSGDEKLIEQELINLIKNSIHALKRAAHAELWLYAHVDRISLTIEVGDNGEGIPEIIDNIFVPFYTTKDEGSGIGLSLSRQIMRMHGGSIAVRSDPGVLTVFTLKFPYHKFTVSPGSVI